MDSLTSQLAAGVVDANVLEELALTASALDTTQIKTLRDALLPLLVPLGTAVPASLVEALLRDSTLDEALAFMPQLHLTGTKKEDPVILRIITSKLTTTENHHQLLADIVNLAAKDTSLEFASELEALYVKLARLHVLADLAPFEAMYNGSFVLQSRLMSLLLALASAHELEPNLVKWAVFRLNPDDDLESMVVLEFYEQLLRLLPSSHIDPLDGVLRSLAELSKTDSVLLNSVQRVLVSLGRFHLSKFMVLDSQFSLVQPDRTLLLSLLPPDYIAEHHPNTVKRLELTDRTLPVFANLATDPLGYQLLDMPAGRVNRLTMESRLKLATAATVNKSVAKVFVATYPTLFDALAEFQPTDPALADARLQLQKQLLDINVRLTRKPAVATVSN